MSVQPTQIHMAVLEQRRWCNADSPGLCIFRGDDPCQRGAAHTTHAPSALFVVHNLVPCARPHTKHGGPPL